LGQEALGMSLYYYLMEGRVLFYFIHFLLLKKEKEKKKYIYIGHKPLQTLH